MKSPCISCQLYMMVQLDMSVAFVQRGMLSDNGDIKRPGKFGL
jgi:hypothetical protein